MSINTRFFVLSILSIILTLLPLHSAIAATATSTSISGNVVWSKAAGPYLVNSVYVLRGATLTIEPGTVVMATLDSTPFIVEGTLNIGATSGEKVSITSIRDDGGPIAPARGDWRDIVVYTGGALNVVNTDISYGGNVIPDGAGGFDHLPLIQNEGGMVSLDHTKLSSSSNDGLRLNTGTVTVSSSTFTNLGSAGISGSHGTFRVFGSTFDNMAYGMFIATASSLDFGQNTFTNIISHKAVDFGSSQVRFLDRGGNSGQASIFLTFQLTEDTVFPKDGLAFEPYSVEVPLGRTLTILPGAVIKMNPTSNFAISGNLIVGSPTAVDKVYITSIKDDSVLGDTNSDGSTTPLPGDWQDLAFSVGSSAQISNAIIHYGGSTSFDPYVGAIAAFPTIKNSGGILTLDNVTLSQVGNYGFSQNSGSTTITNSTITNAAHSGIIVEGGNFAVHNSSIHDNLEYGIFNGRQRVIDATNNWWGSATGPTHATNPTGAGDRVSDNVDYGQWLTEEPQGTCVIDCNSNVLFLPGLEASRLYETDSFGFEHRRWEPAENFDTKNLFLDETGRRPGDFANPFVQIYTRDVIDEAYPEKFGFAASNIYKSFLTQLKDMKETQRVIKDYSVVPYDWRLSLEDILNGGIKTGSNISYVVASSDPYIISELRRLVASSRTGKVTIIAHSNGGLVTKALIKRLEEARDPLLYKIDKIVFVAVPQTGTPQAIGALLHGYKQGIPASAPFFLSDYTARALAKNLPAAYNLLPSTLYFHDVQTPVVTFATTPLFNPEQANYGTSIDNTSELTNYLLNNEGATARTVANNLDIKTPPALNLTLINGAALMHARLDNLQIPTSIQVIEIAGWGVDTLAGIEYKENHHLFSSPTWDYNPTLIEDGDGTVVAPSALAMSTSSTNVLRYWLNLQGYNDDHKVRTALGLFSASHADILEVQNLRSFIGDIFTNNPANLSQYQYLSTSTPRSISTKKLRYFLHSPLTLNLYDTEGHHAGISTTTGFIDSQIPGVYYREFGEVKYITAPASTTSHLILNGQGTGFFSLDIQEVVGDSIIATATFADIPTSTSTVVTMDFSNGTIVGASPLHIDRNADGIIDFNLTPKLGGIVTLDTTPPVTTASTIGTLGNNGWYTSNVLVALSATATENVIASTTYTLNNGASWNDYIAPFIIATEGSITLLYRSTDNAGNIEATNTLKLKIDKTTPEADVVLDSLSQVLTILGIDNLSSTTVVTTATSSNITDQAGHTLQVLFDQSPSKAGHINLAISKLIYDGVSNTATATLKYKWNISPRGSYKMFAARAATSTTGIESHYRSKKNVTIIMKYFIDTGDNDADDDVDARLVKTTLPGMVVVGLKTQSGKIQITY